MCSVKVFVGLDYHQDQVQLCVVNEAGKVLCNRGLPNDAGAIREYFFDSGVPRGPA